MHAADWLLTLQWTALFGARMLVAVGPGPLLAGGAALAAGWLATTEALPATAKPARRMGTALLRWSVRLVAGGVALVLATACAASPLTGDGVLASQLRAAITDGALTLSAGAGLAGAAGLLWSRLAARTA